MVLSPRARIERALGRAVLSLPDAALARLAPPPRSDRGFSLDPEISLLLRLQTLLSRPPTHTLSVARARDQMDVDLALLTPPRASLARLQELALVGPAGRIPARVYRPRAAAGMETTPSPAVVFYHGGGMVTGSLASHDGPCRQLAADTECVVVAVDYRLAPEHRFPGPVEDAVAAFRAVAERSEELGLDPSKLVVAGDSAGGTLSAVVSLETRGDAIRPCFQALVYPATELTWSFPSIRAMGSGYLLERPTLDWFMDHYLGPDQDRRDPRASPLYAESHAGAPPAFVLTAGFDPLRDEGIAYAEAIARAGVPAEHRCYESLPHGFFNMIGMIRAAREPFADLVGAIRRAVGRG